MPFPPSWRGVLINGTKSFAEEAIELLNLIANFTTYTGDEPDIEDAISTINLVIEKARAIKNRHAAPEQSPPATPHCATAEPKSGEI